MEKIKQWGKDWSGLFAGAICLFAFLSLQIVVIGLVFDSKIGAFTTEINGFKTEIIREIDSLRSEVQSINKTFLRHETEIKAIDKNSDNLKNTLLLGK